MAVMEKHSHSEDAWWPRPKPAPPAAGAAGGTGTSKLHGVFFNMLNTRTVFFTSMSTFMLID